MTDTTNKNLIVNGDFEKNPTNNAGYANTTSKNVLGWQTSTGNIQIQESNYGSGNAVGDGIVELNSYTGEIFQTINVTEAGSYSLSLNHSTRQAGGGTLSVMVDGKIIEVATVQKGNFQTLELDLDLSAGAHEIRLIGKSGTTNYFGVTVDDIVLQKNTAPAEVSAKSGAATSAAEASSDTQAKTTLGENLIVNGDFEKNPTNNAGYANTTSKNVLGWQTSTGNIQIQESNYGSGNAVGDGIVELNSYTGEIFQTINVTEAGSYSLSLNHSTRQAGGGTLSVMVDGKIIEVATVQKGNFQTLELDLDLSAGAHEIRLIGKSGTTNYFGVTVDDINLRQVITPEAPAGSSTAPEPISQVALAAKEDDTNTIVMDGTLEFSNFTFVESATTGDQAGISDGRVTGNPFGDGINFTDFAAFASGPNSRVDTTISYTVKQTDPLTAIQQIGAQFNISVDIDGENVSFGRNGPSRDLGDIEANLVHSVYEINEDGSKGALLGSITLDVRDPDFRDPPYESKDFLLDGNYRELLVESRLVLDTNSTDAKLTLSVIGNNYESGKAPGSLSGTYFCDEDRDGVDDGAANGDVDIAGKKVELFQADGKTPVTDFDGNPVGPVTTDANGNYRFDNLKPGEYVVKFEDSEAEGKNFIDQNVGDNDAIDSDADPSTGVTGPNTVYAGKETPNVDVGVEKTDPGTASLGDTVWYDTDKDGRLDAGEKGAAGVTVELVGAGEDGEFGTDDDISRTTTTDANGKYLFDNLDAGDYKVTFGEPDGYDFTVASTVAAQNVNNDSDAGEGGMTDVINLEIGEAERDVDAGLINPKPVAPTNPDDIELCEDTSETFNVFDNDGAKGLTLLSVKHENPTLDAIFASRGGSISFDADGDVTYKGMTNYYGFDKLVYTAVDANGVKYTETVDVELTAASDVTTPAASGWHPGGWATPLAGGVWAHKYNPITDFKINDDADKLQQFGTYNQNVADDRDQVESITLTGLASDPNEAWVVYRGEKLSFANGQEYEIPFLDIKAGLLQLEFTKPNGWGHKLSWKFTDTGNSGGACGSENESSITTTTIYTPIALDLNGDNKIGVTGETTSHDKSGIAEMGKTVEFDMDADGDLEITEWLSGDGDAFLFDNRDGNAINEMNGARLFGDANGHANGYDKLAELDADGDGMLRGNELEGLQLWADNGDAVMTEDEIVLLSDVGVVAISSEMELVKDEDGRDLMQSVAELSNGEQMLTEDVWFMGA